MSGWTGQYHGKAVWKTVGHGCETPDPQQDSTPDGARSVRRDALEIASSELLNSRHTRQYKAYKANIQGIEGKAIDVWMDRPVPWKSPVEHRGHGCETPDPQQDSSPRRCQKRAQRCSRNSIFGTAKFKAYKAIQGKYTRHRRQSHRCLDGPASTMEKPCGKLWGMVAKHRIRSRIQAQGGAIEGKAIDVWMDRPVPWKSPVEHRGHGCETPDQPQRGARSVRRDAFEKA